MASKINPISIKTQDQKQFTAFLAQPVHTPAPAVLVLPEIYNSNEHIRSVAEKFADDGFLALAPDVYWRIEAETYLPYTPEGQQQARAMNEKLDVDQLISDLGDCVKTLQALPECNGKVAAMGFCLGGKLAYLCGTRLPVSAMISYYGVKIDDYLDESAQLNCPALFHFAENDEHVPAATVAKIEAVLQAEDNVGIHLYPGTGHGFNRKGYPPYHQPSADLAWQRTLELLQQMA